METNSKIIAGISGGQHVIDGPLTTANISEASPTLLRSEIESRVVQIRPMSTPVDQISRMIGARPAGSMKVEYYSVDSKPVKAKITSEADVPGWMFNDSLVGVLSTDNDPLFVASETVLVPSIEMTDKKSGRKSPLMLYVVKQTEEKHPAVIAVNGVDDEFPEIPVGTELIRMGRAASELDVQTAQYGALPLKDFNYCQIFKTQIEQSLYVKMSSKETGWSFNDQEEVAVMDMRMGMEKNFLFGTRARLINGESYDDVLLTGGIWNQASTEHQIKADSFDDSALVGLMRTAFTGEAAGSPKKVLIAGGGFIEKLSKLSYVRNVGANEKVTYWGIDFTEVASKFGSLYVIYSEIFDQCGHGNDALIIDTAYIAKYVHVPFKVDMIDMQKTGARNTQALVATEASCIVLRHPKAHVKVTLA